MEEKKKTKRIYPLRYQSNLSEKDDANAAVYFEHLDRIMAMKELHNIALTGNRGAGKSSILHSYDKTRHRSGEKYLYISLAEFENYIEEAAQEEAAQEKKKEVSSDSQPHASVPETETPPTEAEKKVKEIDPINKPRQLSQKGRERIQKRLEYSLLCQILARCTKEDLRSSSLRAITEMRESRRWVKLRYTYMIVLALLACVLMYDVKFQLPFFGELIEERWSYNYWHEAAYALAAVMTVGLGAYLFSRKPGFFRFGKINLKTAKVEAEIVPSEDVYCLDKYRFEMVYILNQIADKIGYTVVIEDLELVGGCCAEVIVSKLRELNLMVNIHRREQYRNGESFVSRLRRRLRNWLCLLLTDRKNAEIDLLQESARTKMKGIKKCAKPVRFVYAISDDTFDEEERTKFFDTILPMTPALNATNSYKTLKNCFVGKAGMSAPKADVFISKLSKAVTDYRMLNDIITEYQFFSRWHEKNVNTPDTDAEKMKDVPARVPKDWSNRYGMLGRIFSRAAKSTDDMVNKENPKGKVMSDEEREKEEEKKRKEAEERLLTEEKKRKVERSLIAIATYKALLPYEYHYAYTPEGGGQLINPVRERIKGQSYRESTVECVKFLFDEGYLDAEVLTLIGFSREVLKLQWADILTNGDAIQQLDLLYRFDPVNASRDDEEQEDLFSEVVRKKASEGELDKERKEELVMKLGEKIFPSSDDALIGLFGKLFDDDLTPDGLLNLLICLGRFDDEELKGALMRVNKGADHDLHLNEFQNRLQKCMNKTSFKSRLEDDDFRRKMVGTVIGGAVTEPSRCQQVVDLVLKMETNLSDIQKLVNAITA